MIIRRKTMQSAACFSLRPQVGVRAASATTAAEPDRARADAASDTPRRVELRTGKGCALGIAKYPNFVYNAQGGGGTGRILEVEESGRLQVLIVSHFPMIVAVKVLEDGGISSWKRAMCLRRSNSTPVLSIFQMWHLEAQLCWDCHCLPRCASR